MARDHIRLVDAGDRSVAAGSVGEPQHAVIAFQAPGQDEPFGEERRLQVGGQHRGAVEQALGQPVLTCGVAGGLPPGGDLRHADHRPDAGLGGRLRDDDGGVQQAGSDRIREVGAGYSPHGRAHVTEVQQVARDDLGTGRGQGLGSVVVPVHERAHSVPALE